jgi:predicted double-glycine peptidase
MSGVTLKSVLMLFCLGGVLLAAEGSSIWLDVPFVRQEKDGCGAASMAMIMEYWQRQPGQSLNLPDAQQILSDLYSKEARGIYASDMESYFRAHGFQTFAFAGEWSDLQQHLEKGRPLIVALKPGSGASLHYVVVTGLEPGYVLTNDPAERKLLKQARSNFEREWKAAKHWTLLAVPSLRSSPQ